MNGKTIGIIAVVLIIIAGGWYMLSSTPTKTPTTTNTENQTPSATNTVTSNTTTTTTTITGVIITYGIEGFSPKNVTVPVGTKVTFVNQKDEAMWIASAQHPTHMSYDGTSKDQHCAAGYTGAIPFDQCSAGAIGTTYSFTFTKAGTWPYHNHASASDFGSITVTP